MKVLVVAHRLELGGTQVNALDLAAAVRDRHDHDVVVAATPGPAVELIRERGLRLIPLPDAVRHPSPARVRALTSAGSQERPDLVHVWDWPQCFDAYPGLYLRQRRPMLCTVMSMAVPRFLPRHLPTTFGTPALARSARRSRGGAVHLLEPPVDLQREDAGSSAGPETRRSWGCSQDEHVIVVVSRLEEHLKLEGLERAIAAVRRLAVSNKIKLVLVGEGSAQARLQALADDVNAEGGSDVVLLPGPSARPQAAYSAADVVLGMGGSALRAMAACKPVIVLGERGFSRVLDESSVQCFLEAGWYGLGDGTSDDLAGQVERLLSRPDERARLGQLGHDLVHSRYGLAEAADQLDLWYRQTASTPVPVARAVREAARSAVFVLGRDLVDGIAGWSGRSPATTESPGPQPEPRLSRASA